MGLSELDFRDLILPEVGTPLLKGLHGSQAVTALPQGYGEDIEQLRKGLYDELQAHPGRRDWCFRDKGGVQYRVKYMSGGPGGRPVFYLRRHARGLTSLNDLGYPSWLSSQLCGASLRSGLVLFAGNQGAGKTTGASAYVAERLAIYGGTALTVECPIEIALDGHHGLGWCHQTEVESESDFEDAITQSFRCGSPDILYLGEIRESRGSSEAIKAACTTYLVVSTIHGAGIIESLERLLIFASGGVLGSKAQDLVAQAFAACIHQSLEVGPDGQKQLRVSTLFATDAVRAKLRSGQLFQLKDLIEQQRSQRMHTGRTFS